MNEKETILCPGKEHKDFKKRLFFKSDNALFVHCKTHKWIKIEFLKGGDPISFKGTVVKLSPVKWDFIDSKEVPTVSVGSIKNKAS